MFICGWMIACISGVFLIWFMEIREISHPQPTANCPLQIVLYNPRFYGDLRALRLELSMPGVLYFVLWFFLVRVFLWRCLPRAALIPAVLGIPSVALGSPLREDSAVSSCFRVWVLFLVTAKGSITTQPCDS